MTSFEDKLRAAMAKAALPRETTHDDHALLQAKLAARRSRGLRVRRWRMPLLAAAAVVAVAVATVAIVAPGSDDTNHVAAPGTGDADTSGAANTTMLDASDGPGTEVAGPGVGQGSPATNVSVAPTIATPPVQTEPVTVPVDMGFAGTAGQSVDLQLLASGGLQLTGVGTDGEAVLVHSDGTPLGYVHLAPSRSVSAAPEARDGGGAYLYGLVSPAVDRIAVLVTDSGQHKQDEAGGSYAGAQLRWVVADQGDPVGTDGRGARILWTEIGDGWRAFAVRTAAHSLTVTVLAWNSDRELLQARQFDPNSDTVTDLPTAHAPDLDVWDPQDPAPRFGPDGPNGAGRPYVATYPDLPDSNYHDALLEGTMAVYDGCVVATSDSGGVFTLIFPQVQVESAEPPAVVRFNGTDYHQGDPIAVSGAETTFTSPGASIDCPTHAWSVTPP